MSMEHTDNYANEGYSFKTRKYTMDELIEIMDYSNMVQSDYVDIIRFQDIDDAFIQRYIDRFETYLDLYANYHKISDDMIKYLYDNNIVDEAILLKQYLSDDVIDHIIGDDMTDKISFINGLIKTQELNDDNILRFYPVADYSILFKYQNISESTATIIFDNSDDNKKHIMCSVGAIYQWWSDDYVVEHADYIDWFRYYIYPERVRIPYTKMDYFIPDDPNGYHPDDIEWPILSDEVDPRLLNINNKHVPVENWRKLIGTQFPLYDKTDDYFVGYIITTSNNYSIYDFKLLFTDGSIITKHADITNRVGSFGVTLRSLDELKHLTHDYIVGDSVGNKKIKLVKAHYSDVCCAYKTPVGYDIRVRKLEVLRDYND